MRSSSKILKLQRLDGRVLTITAPEPQVTANGECAAGLAPAVEGGDAGDQPPQDPILVLEAAQQEASRIVAEAEATALEVVEGARAEGYQSGYEAGIAAAEEEMRQRLQSIAAIAANVTVDKAALVKECESAITNLVIETAQKVIVREISLDRSIIVKIVASALERVVGQAILRIRVSPDDYELVRQYWTERQGPEDSQSPTEIIADKRVKAGGCIIDTQGGTIDAQIDTQLAEIKQAFDVVTELM